MSYQAFRQRGSILAEAKFGWITEEVLQHLTTLPHVNVKLPLEIEADTPDGVPDDVQRVVMENRQALKFATNAFEQR